MGQGRKINEFSAGGVIVSVWKDIDPPKHHHNDFQVDVGVLGDDDWVCIGGGGKGHLYPGNYLTASFPSDDFKSWKLRSRDHIDGDESPLIGYAIGMKIPGLTKAELISNLKIFPNDSVETNHPFTSAWIDGDEYTLLGGGAHITRQPSEDPQSGEIGGNMLTGCYIDSTISWHARSKDHFYPWKSPITAFAIGIRKTLKKGNEVFGTAITTFHSLDTQPQAYDLTETTVRPLPGYALCGGGGAAYFRESVLILALVPTTLENFPTPTDPTPLPVILAQNDQSFTAIAKGAQNEFPGYHALQDPNPHESAHLTAFAMGIKVIPIALPPPNPPPPPSCNNPVTITDSYSPVTLNPASLPDTKVWDNDLNTFWMSKVGQKPWIRLGLQGQKRVCRVDIAWRDGNVRIYKFTIELSPDNVTWTMGITGQSQGNTSSYESYAVTPTSAGFIRITVTDSGSGPNTAQAQITEVKVFTDQ